MILPFKTVVIKSVILSFPWCFKHQSKNWLEIIDIIDLIVWILLLLTPRPERFSIISDFRQFLFIDERQNDKTTKRQTTKVIIIQYSKLTARCVEIHWTIENLSVSQLQKTNQIPIHSIKATNKKFSHFKIIYDECFWFDSVGIVKLINRHNNEIHSNANNEKQMCERDEKYRKEKKKNRKKKWNETEPSNCTAARIKSLI